MANEIRVGIVGIDTSHSTEFPKRMQAPDCPPLQKVEGLRAVSCMAFTTPFQNQEGVDKRTKLLESWGVKVTSSFEETVKNIDAVMIELNDPALFEALKKIQKPDYGYFFGPLGLAASGSSVVWYGVHTFEMMVKAMGRGALSCKTVKHSNGVVITVEYPDKKSAVADMQEGCFSYGGVLRVKTGESVPYVVDVDRLNTDLVRELYNFLKGGLSPVPLEDTLHVMALLDASERSLQSGNTEKVPQ